MASEPSSANGATICIDWPSYRPAQSCEVLQRQVQGRGHAGKAGETLRDLKISRDLDSDFGPI